MAMKERFTVTELCALRNDLIQGGMVDSREAAELLQVFSGRAWLWRLADRCHRRRRTGGNGGLFSGRCWSVNWKGSRL